ncbi:hypothetical protein TeGR_g10718 [Tetraparma gracilis]|uniref:Uncharacterized protein n=1 Tax=Tetraparma gracilis TaxID=2962635 RepID=A0ABQ6MY56_9STRA|nr:hypothetical protein TeGR_g10718 [Tetraparma gracilis]
MKFTAAALSIAFLGPAHVSGFGHMTSDEVCACNACYMQGSCSENGDDMKGCMNCGCFWNKDSAKCEEDGPDKCLPAEYYHLDRKKCNECYPYGALSQICGKNGDDGNYMREPSEGLGGMSRCDVIIDAMGGEGIWDDAVHQQMIEQTHTWVDEEGEGHWERNCLEPCDEYDGCDWCERRDETWSSDYDPKRSDAAYTMRLGYVDGAMKCNTCSNAWEYDEEGYKQYTDPEAPCYSRYSENGY